MFASQGSAIGVFFATSLTVSYSDDLAFQSMVPELRTSAIEGSHGYTSIESLTDGVVDFQLDSRPWVINVNQHVLDIPPVVTTEASILLELDLGKIMMVCGTRLYFDDSDYADAWLMYRKGDRFY